MTALNREQAVCLIEEFRALEKLAHQARQRLAAGAALNGTAAFYKLETRANDARRFAERIVAEDDDDQAGYFVDGSVSR
jgi:hypothetical protein